MDRLIREHTYNWKSENDTQIVAQEQSTLESGAAPFGGSGSVTLWVACWDMPEEEYGCPFEDDENANPCSDEGIEFRASAALRGHGYQLA